jgi:hypothetical protein
LSRREAQLDQPSGPQNKDRRSAVAALSQFVATSINAARVGTAPFRHLVFERVFPDDIYNAMLTAMPDASDYRPMSEKRRRVDLADGLDTRFKIDLLPEFTRRLPPDKRAVWDVVGRALCSDVVKAAMVRALAPALEERFGPGYAKVGMYPIPILTRDVAGYHIHPHTDTRWKGITVQLYLPRDESSAHVGTIFNEHLGNKVYRNVVQMKFLPNTGYAFAVGADTWHSADKVGPEVKTRDSILLTYFVDDSAVKVLRNRAKRVGNLLLGELRRLRR